MQSRATSRGTPINIILFGDTGVGKSSVINLIAGRMVAEVSQGAVACTKFSKEYLLDVDGRRYSIWDTVGVDDRDMGTNGYLNAIEKAHELIQHLSQEGGVDLLLFCIPGNRITVSMQSNYRLFYEVLCGSAVPISLVITHLEREPDMDAWWSRNSNILEKYGIKGARHACVTGLPDHSQYGESRLAIQYLLDSYDGKGKYYMPSEAWFIQSMRAFGIFAPPKGLKGKKLVDALTKRCRLDPKVAQIVAKKLGRAP
ncbi:P-loop containing nucleoside triphosphate hydrolase protein [Melanogaster broomeanus]|nr:P-loop containing nucleoside triphosphate hydrolase protein [Melanogaster broomeanus]